jgi:hypothetical protein
MNKLFGYGTIQLLFDLNLSAVVAQKLLHSTHELEQAKKSVRKGEVISAKDTIRMKIMKETHAA